MLLEDVLTMNSEYGYSKTVSPGPMKEELEAAKKVLAVLLLARKNYSLYPENHTICINAITHLHSQLETYLHKYGDLRLEIESDRLVSQGEILHLEPPEEGMLPFTLFRDGIRCLEFTDGIDPGELKEFLRIVNKYNMLSNEPEGDIVTALWESKFSHIKYEVADFSWGSGQDIEHTPSFEEWNNSSTLFRGNKAGEREVDFTVLTNKGDKVSVSLRENKLVDWETLTDPVIDQASLLLAPEELVVIQEMIRHEEEADQTEYLDALLDSLLENREQENFKIVFEVLEEEFKNSLTRRDFDIVLKILRSLQYIHDACTADIPWASPLIEDFYLTVSSPQALSPLQTMWPDLDSGQIRKIEQILKLLQPDAIHTLSIILLQNHSSQHRQVIVDAMSSLASRDPRILESLLKSPDDKLVQMLVHVLVKLKGEQSSKVLLELVHHKSEYVRQEAIKRLLQLGPARVQDVFKLIDDKEESIRRLILKYIGQSRNLVSEVLLLNYLEHKKFNSTDSQHVIACFMTLGKCGSSRSIPFLHRTLLSKGWMPSFWRSAHRKGAAIALSVLGLKQARKIVEEASHSLYPSVRCIVRKAKLELA